MGHQNKTHINSSKYIVFYCYKLDTCTRTVFDKFERTQR